ncbi:MAG: hypothetical protein GY820_08910 [Gammaproteobacteria bacterium]|nr:hypothetical protein [Gammaproteobacteria bacterium]
MISKFKPLLMAVCLMVIPFTFAAEPDCNGDDFPTAVVADYVLGCMAANGNSFTALHQCSCSIDFIKSRMTYSEYEKTQTIMQIQQDRGNRGIFYRESNWARKQVDALQKYQAESTLRCF